LFTSHNIFKSFKPKKIEKNKKNKNTKKHLYFTSNIKDDSAKLLAILNKTAAIYWLAEKKFKKGNKIFFRQRNKPASAS
jgi:hypothetical protein